MGRIIVLDPTAAAADEDLGPGPDLPDVRGRRIGIRLDRTWRSFQWVADEWEAALRDAGAEVTRWMAGNRVGAEGERTRRELDAFVGSVDGAVIGLGN
jgi:hypothetical protein